MQAIKFLFVLIFIAVAYIGGRIVAPPSSGPASKSASASAIAISAIKHGYLVGDESLMDSRWKTIESGSSDSVFSSDTQGGESGRLALSPAEGLIDTMIKALDERLSSEPVDSLWAGRSESRIWRGVSASGLALSSAESECRSTLCRTTLNYAIDMGPDEIVEIQVAMASILREAMETQSQLSADIATAQWREITDDRGRVTSSIIYFFRDKPLPVDWALVHRQGKTFRVGDKNVQR